MKIKLTETMIKKTLAWLAVFSLLVFSSACADSSRADVVRESDTNAADAISENASAKDTARGNDARIETSDNAENLNAGDKTSALYHAPVRFASINDKSISESSGVAASRRTDGVFWTHNDSGGGARLYAFDRQGNQRGAWQVTGATNRDWEDIAATINANGDAQLYIADIGDNLRRRNEIIVYRVTEPAIDNAAANTTDTQTSNAQHRFAETSKDARSGKSNSKDDGKRQRKIKKGDASAHLPATAKAEAIRLRYPEGATDAETLMVHPQTQDVYIVAKTFARQADVFRVTHAEIEKSIIENSVATLEKIAAISLPGMFGTLVTGGDISPDARRVVLCDYARGYELILPAKMDSTKDFARIWEQKKTLIDIGNRSQGEGVCYTSDGTQIISTSENNPMTAFRAARR